MYCFDQTFAQNNLEKTDPSKFEYEFCQTNDNQDGQQNGRGLSFSML